MDPRTSRWISVDPAVGEYVPTAGSDNSNLPGMGGVYNIINLHCFAYAGNNPVKYKDPDGKYMLMFVNKKEQTMTIHYTDPEGKKPSVVMTLGVVTNVVKGDSSKASDETRRQGPKENQTRPTQAKDGVYNIEKEKAVETNNADGKYGETGLLFDIIQDLPKVGGKDGETVKDGGYMLHITPNDFTNGCVGIKYDENDPDSKAKAEAMVQTVVDMFNDNKKAGASTTVIFE